ncbi:MAG: CehA/McbA family metallohydrolase [Deltaproteobacteria bacterium]|nr:CehA/McbA family metallohydrolase [Deltaproteobacteria bacterium]
MARSDYVRTVGRGLLAVTVTLCASGCALGSCGQEPWDAQADAGVDGEAGTGCADPSCCMPAVPDHQPTGGAAAGVLTDPATDPNAIGGPGATARAGDYYLKNSCVRFVIQKPGRVFSAVPEGGTIIDADLVRPVGEPGADEFGELTGFVNAMLYTKFDDPAPDKFKIVNDGSDGKAAVIEVRGGRIDVLEYMNIPAILYESFKDAMDQVITVSQQWVDNVEVWVRYALLPDECMVRVTYALYNGDAASGPTISTSVGTFYQAAGEGSAFMPGFGFGPIDAKDAFITPRYVSKVFGNVGRKVAYSLRASRYVNDEGDVADLGSSSQVTIAGLSLTIFGEPAPLAALSPGSRESPFTLKPQHCGWYEHMIGVGRDLAAAQAAVALDTAQGHVSGTVTPPSALTDTVRVAVFQNHDPLDPDSVRTRKVASSFAVRADGTYGGDLPVATYVLELDFPGYPRLYQKVTVAQGETITAYPFDLPQTATVNYNVTAGGAPTACRISVIGQVGDKVTGIRSNQYRDTLFDKYDNGLAYVEVSSVCDGSSTATGAAGPLKVVPGTYRIVVSHGPEYSTVDQLNVNLTAGGSTTVTGDLKKRIGSDGWVAVDLHQHAYYSFDSRLPHERRLTAYLAEGVEFFGASEHDRIFDYIDLIEEMGYSPRLATMTGTEISPMHYGHFNAFELTPDMTNPASNGAPDWSRDPDFTRTTVVVPDDLLGMAQAAGADLISANHPRAPDSLTFLYWWDRCGLFVAFGAPDMAHAVGCNPDLAAVPWEKLDVANGATLWTDKFDLIEIYNRPTPICKRLKNVLACKEGEVPEPCVPETDDPGGRTFDAQVDTVMQDWFNMLQVGFIRSIVGNSDSHKVVGEISGVPRSYVFVGSGQDSPTNPQLKNLIKAALLPAPTGSPPRLAAAAVATNGPLVNLTVHGFKAGSPTSAGIGGLLQHDQATVDVAVRVEAPDWMHVDRIEVFVNQGANVYTKEQLAPGDRANAKVGEGAQPLLQTDAGLVAAIPSGAWQMAGDVRYYETTITVPVPSATDSWIVVRVSGGSTDPSDADKRFTMYPVLPDLACFKAGDDPASTAPMFGTAASAITNPIFVDRDGVTGWRGPEAP